MSACFGIHLGNSSMCIALNRDGKSEVIANDLGDRVTPALLAYDGAEFEVCASSKSNARKRATIADNKRTFDEGGVPEDAVEALNARNDCKLVQDDEGAYAYELSAAEAEASSASSLSLTPDRVATKFYEKMFGIAARAACSEDELRTVVAVPHRWSEESRRRIATAAELSGFSVSQVINEPTAALLAYDVGSDRADDHVLVYRLGGASADAAVVRSVAGVYTIVKSVHRFGAGGRHVTSALADYMAAEFFQRWKLDPRENRRAMEKLFHGADDCKRILSTLNTAHAFIESLCEGVDWSQNVSRARFDNLLAPLVESLLSPIRELLASDPDLGATVTKVIVCGGSMKIPKLQAAVADLLPNATLLEGISPDEVVAIGCAKQAQLLLEFPDVHPLGSSMTVDCIKYPIHAKYADSDICIFPSGVPVRSEAEVPFQRMNKSMNIDLHVYRREEIDEVPIGDFSFDCGSANPKICAILNNEELILDVV